MVQTKEARPANIWWMTRSTLAHGHGSWPASRTRARHSWSALAQAYADQAGVAATWWREEDRAALDPLSTTNTTT